MTLLTEHQLAGETCAGWHPDPTREHQLRYFDGSHWTTHVTHFGPTPCDGCWGDPAADTQ